MSSKSIKALLVLVFSVLLLFSSNNLFAQDDHIEKKQGFNAKELIFGHVLNAHYFHFLDIRHKDGTTTEIGIPLPVILYSSPKGFSVFMSSAFEHGHKTYDGYMLLTDESIEKLKLDEKKFSPQQVVAVNDRGQIDASVKVYDISLTRNVVQMIIGLSLFVWVMLRIAKRYKSGVGVTSAPKGSQSLFEPVVTFVRDEVAIPNLGDSHEKYLPFLLTIFFFILINNLIGLIPGSANVTGNIAFTFMFGVIAFVAILASSNKYYWGHIFNPPGVPGWVKGILVPVEVLGVFTKPFALIIRLFANMVAGHIIIICLISLIFIFANLNIAVGWGVSPVSIAFTIFIYFIEVLVAFIQAFIFAMLTAVFIGQAKEGAHHHGEGSADDAVIV
ncbi:MAG TPA: F0F1 ATP synthase subunit A, partial [Puia sp.]|nr:F0F1 ATP synthase subunit A [Puia sp.]